MTDRLLVWGAGAIGGTFGAVLARAGHDVTFVDVVPEHVAAIRDTGLHVHGPVDELTIRVPAFLPVDLKGTWPVVFLAVKAQHTREAAEALRPHLADSGCVVSLQNGLCEDIIAEAVGATRTVGAFINFGADWLGPGDIQWGNRGAFVLGELDGRSTDRLERLLGIARAFEPNAVGTDRIHGFLWGKLGYGSMLFAQALGDLGIADTLARPDLLPLWRRLAGEVNRVAAAQGIEPIGFNGYDPAAFSPSATEADGKRAVDAMVAFNRPSAKTHSGVWRDLAVRKRRTEVDVQIAPIAAIGARHGIDCPAIRRLVAMIHEVEDGRRPISDRNLTELAA